MSSEVLQDYKGFVKCILRNKYTLGGYAGTLIGGGGLVYQMTLHSYDSALCITGIVLYVSLSVLGVTGFGLSTFNEYRRIRDGLSKMPKPEITDSLKRHYQISLYCWKKGIELAVKEQGLDLEGLVDS